MRDAHLEYCGVLEAQDGENILVDEQAKNEDDDEDRGSTNIHSNSNMEPLTNHFWTKSLFLSHSNKSMSKT